MAVPSIRFLDLPDVLLYQIISFSAGKTYRASIVCHTLGLLSQEAAEIFLNETSLIWNAIQVSDYGVQMTHGGAKRSSKRLKQTHLQRVRDAHLMVQKNTEIAYFYLSEACVAQGKNKLTRSKLCSILEEFGPHLRLNSLMSTGGTFLVECCRARHVRENAILKCVEELIQNRGASLNLSTSEPPPNKLTALCVASARGMPTVVRYLLKAGASAHIRCTGRFRLYTNSRKSVKCSDATPLEFAKRIRETEEAAGATVSDLAGLDKCIRLLQRHERSFIV